MCVCVCVCVYVSFSLTHSLQQHIICIYEYAGIIACMFKCGECVRVCVLPSSSCVIVLIFYLCCCKDALVAV